MKPIEDLVREHSLLNLLWSTLEKQTARSLQGEKLNVDTTKELLDAVKMFALGPHIGKEEKHLVPVMLAAGVPEENLHLTLLLSEHERIRDEVGALFLVFEELYAGNARLKRKFATMVSKLADFVRLHIYREEYHLYPTAEMSLTDAHWTDLGTAFQQADIAFGEDNAVEFEDTVLRIAQEFGLGLYNGNVVPVLPSHLKPRGRFIIETYQPR